MCWQLLFKVRHKTYFQDDHRVEIISAAISLSATIYLRNEELYFTATPDTVYRPLAYLQEKDILLAVI